MAYPTQRNTGAATAPPVSLPTCTFIDIETVRGHRHFDDLNNRLRELFMKKFDRQYREEGAPGWDQFYERHAALYAEWGKICCVSMGMIHISETAEVSFRIKSIASRKEMEILAPLATILSRTARLCAHNGKEFDFPYMTRRMILNEIKIPSVLQTIDKKTWEYTLDDTMDMWSGTQWKYKVSLDLLTALLNLPSPKQDLSGAEVGDLFYSEYPKDKLPFDHDQEVLDQISKYCNGDVYAMANVYCKLKGFELIKPEQIVYV